MASCRAELEERGLPVGETWIDDGKSAWNPKVHRPGWEALMVRLESGAAGGVIVYDLERFTRQPDEASRLIKAATRGMLVLDSDQALDLTTASGIKTFRDEAQSEALARESAERQALLTESASIEQTLTELAARLGRQEMSLARHDAACRPLEARQAAIRAELAELASAEPEPLPVGIRTIPEQDAAHVDWLERWIDGTPAERRAMVLRALNGRRLIVGRALNDGKLMVGRENGRRFDPGRVRVED